VQRAVAHVDRRTDLQRVDAVEGNGAPRAGAKRPEPVGGQLGLRRPLQHGAQAAGVVGVVVSQPDPAQLGRVDDRLERRHELLRVDSEARVDEDGPLGEQHEGVHQDHPYAGHLEV